MSWTKPSLKCLSALSGPLFLIAPSSVRSGRPFISLSSHLCISSFWRLALSPSMVTSPLFRAAWSGDRLVCAWFNNTFVTLCLFVLQRSRLWSGILNIWCTHDLFACMSPKPQWCALIRLLNAGLPPPHPPFVWDKTYTGIHFDTFWK